MLNSAAKKSAELKFDLAAPPDWAYAPGDSVIGNLMRRAPVVTPEATLTLWLDGAIRTGISPERSSRYSFRYAEKWNLVERRDEIIFQGPLHIREGHEPPSWPFSIEIPSHPARKTGQKMPRAFLPQDEHEHHTLPPSFYSSGQNYGVSEGAVEYALQARLHYTVGGSHKVHTATFPIKVHQVVDEAPPAYELVERSSLEVWVLSQRLLPGMDKAELSLLQQTQKFLGSSKVPLFQYKITMSLPATIQLDSPEPIPLVMKVVPVPTKTDVSIRDLPQTIEIRLIKLHLQHRTVLITPSNFSNTRVISDEHLYSADLNFPRLETPLVTSTGEENKPIDIGSMFELHLTSSGALESNGQTLTQFPKAITADFTTYTIQHSHRLKFETYVTVAGETQRVDILAPLEILAAV
ncbi:hypothetical protein N7492_002435 [Penicillium capsulatum]|uniref:Arrestin-like N-terminal domain-containing protein n=1 Tax=Penicillium capsulatum TaxID=69766 RepID=A0A9W9IIJ5_9EURO|nr:hypothetical protein N7492_002435 [Penicillium capsulatum]KAJ6122960.1 hypothetical protein N7512_005425 [Penicillium capsulatum]